jgi:type III restriction enzyme
MNPAVNTIANRLSLRPPQRASLEILARICDLISTEKGADVGQALKAVQSEFSTVTDFERDFPSLCFALATGVGKTRLMGAFIAYLNQTEGIRNFFVLAPNLTIYNKLIADFTPNTPKYVFQGIAEFAVEPPEIITGDNYESGRGVRARTLFGEDVAVHVNIFNIGKITSLETPKGAVKTNVPKFRRLQEYIGQSYFDYLSKLDDLVLLMDESHRYRASAGMKAINELKPILGLELTATPQIERGGASEPFKNVIYSYPLSNAMEDGFVKEPAVATRENFDIKNYDEDGLERLKLGDGVCIHEITKVELEVYARENSVPIVKPFMLVIARDTDHANALVKLMEDDTFFEGRYQGKVITVHSALKGEERDDTVEQLIHVEKADNPTEIVVHVNMLKEGWDVTNLYTIVPLRAANSRTLVEQSIGRGLRLPYGKRTGVGAVDRLTIVSHDKFQEIVDYANSPESIIRGGLRVVYVNDERSRLVVAEPEIVHRIAGSIAPYGTAATPAEQQGFLLESPREQATAMATREVIREYECLPCSADLTRPEVQRQIVEKVKMLITPAQGEIEDVAEQVDVEKVVARTIQLHHELSIDIPRITLQPVGDVRRGYGEFKLDLSRANYQPVDSEILIQELHRREQHRLMSGTGIVREKKPEDYLVRGLIDFNDISYDDQAELLYQLAGQTVAHLRSYLKDGEEVLNVLQYHQQGLVNLIHAQMQEHYEEKATAHEAHVSKGFTTLRPNSYSAPADEVERDFRAPVIEKQDIRKMLFSGFKKCLYRVQKFDSDSERRFAVVLEHDSEVLKWFKPTRDEIRIDLQGDKSYEPDFVVETRTAKFVCEAKASNEMAVAEVLAKAQAASEWCMHATDHERQHDGKPWTYLLIPHDVIMDNKTLKGLAARYAYQAGLAKIGSGEVRGLRAAAPFARLTPRDEGPPDNRL